MELNINTQTKPSVTPSVSTNKFVAQQKGSWKKRRKNAVKTRVRVERKLGIRNDANNTKKKKSFDEFASGLDASNENDSKQQSDVNENGKRQDNSASAAQPVSKIRKRQRTRNGTDNPSFKPSGSSISTREPDTKEAIGATLGIVGGRLAEKSRENQQINVEQADADSPDDNRKELKEKSTQQSTFGTGDFESVGLYASVARHLKLRMNMEKPTHIQERVIRSMLELPEGALACDLLVRSATGSGKTLSYLLPIAHYMLNRRKRITREEGSYAIIVVPTRELAEQVESVAAKVFRPWHWIVVGAVRGGEAKKSEKARLRKGVSVLVATPGRLLDHIRNTRSFYYSVCEFLVLDEADRLLDLGFEADIKEIIDNLNRNANQVGDSGTSTIRSNIMLSATMRADVERLAKFSLKEPVLISAENEGITDGNKFSMPSQLRQHLCVVEQRHRLVTLASFLRLRAIRGVPLRSLSDSHASLPSCKVMVFFSTCDSVDFHYEVLNKITLPEELCPKALHGSNHKLIPIPLIKLHGGMDQASRIKSLRTFRDCERGIMLCTDVAARGLDLPGVGFSVQYDPPTGGQGEELEYVHRAGRTARLGAQGDALLFLLPSERAYKSKLENAGVSIQEISINTALAALFPKVRLDSDESVMFGAKRVTSELQEALEQVVKDNSGLKELAYKGYLAYCRAYATHAKEVKHYFHVRNLHLGHVARAFALTDKPAELGALLAEVKAAKAAEKHTKEDKSKKTGDKGSIARAIAEGEEQPYNEETALSRRRRQRGIGGEAYHELASEFQS